MKIEPLKLLYLFVFFVLVSSLYYIYPSQQQTVDYQNINLPKNYTLDKYEIREVTGEKCSKNEDCVLPGKYAIQSNCPYVSLCLKNACTVVCPSYK
jgi:hypothetical protein